MTAKEHAKRLIDNYTRHKLGNPRESTDHAVATAVAYLDLVAAHNELRKTVSFIDARTVMEARERAGVAMTEAEKIRREWLAKMGLSQEEIDEAVRDDPPHSIHAEMKQLEAIEAIQLAS